MITSKYYVENEKGSRLNMNVGGEYFLTGVEGLGVQNENSYADIDNGFFFLSKGKEKQQSIVGSIVFLKNTFENYREIVDFLHAAKELFFVYNPYGSKEYYKKVNIDYITKTSRDGFGRAKMTISFNGMSPWYLPSAVKLQFTESSVQYFQYNVTRYGTAPYAASLSGDFSAEVNPSGHLPAGFDISYTGSLANPSITLTGKDSGKEYGCCSIGYTTASGDTLKISTDYNDSFITLVKANGTEIDLLPYADITKEVFFRMPLGEDCTLRIESEATLDGRAEAFINYYFRSV